jgi:hypothetical protein
MSSGVQSLYLRVRLAARVILAISFPVAMVGPVYSSKSVPPAPNARIVDAYGKLPLSFESNRGQMDEGVRFLARSRGYGLYLERNRADLVLCRASGAAKRFRRKPDGLTKSGACDIVSIQLTGASLKTEPTGEDQLSGTVNYLIGSDPARWHAGIPTYARVRYPGIYSGIDLVYYGNRQQQEFDFVVAPHANPGSIRLRFSGPSHLHLAANGDLILRTAGRALTLRKPSVYQSADGRRVPVSGEFALLAKDTVGFRLGSYDRDRTLVIDPVLQYSTFLSGSGNGNSGFGLIGDFGDAIATDTQGNAYVTGMVLSTDFPVTAGAFQTTDPGSPTAFVTKLNAAGTALVYSTYLGGSNGDQASAIAVDAQGDAYVVGQTASNNFPVTAGAFQTANKGGFVTGFVTELSPSGASLIYSTYLGGSTADGAVALAVDAAGEAYVVGQTSSNDFPVTQGAFQVTNNAAPANTSNAFVAKLSSSGTALIYSTYLGGSGGPRTSFGGCVSAQAAPNDLLGWPLGNNEDGAYAVAVDSAGDVYVAGQALSIDFPVTQGAFQTQNKGAAGPSTNAFVAKLNPAGSALIYSTYLGGSGLHGCGSGNTGSSAGDSGLALAVDGSGNAYIGGVTFSNDFPVTQGAFQAANRCSLVNGLAVGGPTGFVAKLNPSGSALVYSTYLGGSGGFMNPTPDFAQYGGDQASGLAIDGYGDVYVTGSTASPDFPVTPSAYQTKNNYLVSTGACGASCPVGTNGYNAFMTEINSAGSALVYSTYLGGNGGNPNVENGIIVIGTGDVGSALALDNSGNVHITGQAESANFPVTNGAFQTTIPAFASAFVAELNIGPGFTTTATPVTIQAGETMGNTSTITVTPANGFKGTVNLTAAVTSGPGGAQDPPTFSFGSTNSVDITGPSAGTAMLTITTTAPNNCAAAYLMGRVPWYTGGLVLASVLLFCVPIQQRQWRTVLGGLMLLMVAGAFVACGNSGSSCSAGGTTPGNYIVTVSGTSGSTVAPGTFTLTVK